MKIESDKSNIILLTSKTQYEVASTFMRLQEFYESPSSKFKNKFIDFEHYMDWYATENGSFSYTSDWSGFNIPGHIVRNFFKIHWNDLLGKEAALYNILAEWIESDEKFYVIATYTESSDDSVINHEYAHGMFYIFDEYKKLMEAHVKRLPVVFKNRMRTTLKEWGYNDNVIVDEIQAYLSTSQMWYIHESFSGSSKVKIPWVDIAELQGTFNTFKKEKL